MIDLQNKRGLSDEKIFSYRLTQDGKVLISRHGKRVTTLRGSAAAAFVEDVASTHGKEAQFLMAKATGNIGRGIS